MSAFVVRDHTINRILSFLMNWRSREWSLQQFAKVIDFGHQNMDFTQKLGEALLAMNNDAVNQRYEENESVPDYTFKFELVELPQALRSLRCLIYQCSEGNVPETELYKQLDDLSHRWALELCERVPAYANAKWD